MKKLLNKIISILSCFSVSCLLLAVPSQPFYNCFINVNAEEYTPHQNWITYIISLLMARGITFSQVEMDSIMSSIENAYTIWQTAQNISMAAQNKMNESVKVQNGKIESSTEAYNIAKDFTNEIISKYNVKADTYVPYQTGNAFIMLAGNNYFVGSNSDYKYYLKLDTTVYVRIDKRKNAQFRFVSTSPTTKFYKVTATKYDKYNNSSQWGGSWTYNTTTWYFNDNGYRCQWQNGEYDINAISNIPIGWGRDDFYNYFVEGASILPDISIATPGDLTDLPDIAVGTDTGVELELKDILKGVESAQDMINALADQVAQGLTVAIDGTTRSIAYPVDDAALKQRIVSLPKEVAESTSAPTDIPVPTTEPTTIPTISPTTAPDAKSFEAKGLSSVFPFCIPFDLYTIVKKLDVEPKTPSLTWNYPKEWGTSNGNIITVDLHWMDDFMKVSRKAEDILIIVGLAVATKGLIQGGS